MRKTKLHLGIGCLISLLTLGSCQVAPGPLGQSPFQTASLSLSSIQAQTLIEEPADAPFLMQTQKGRLFLVYHALQAPHTQLFLRSSLDGKKWSAPQQLTSHELSVNNPRIIEDASGTLQLFYTSNEGGQWHMYKSESKDGVTWSRSRQLKLPVAQITDASVLHDGQAYRLAYQSFGGGIFLSSSDNGENWSVPLKISDIGESPHLTHHVDGHFSLLYEGPDPTGWNIYQLTSSNLLNWSAPKALTQLKRARWGRMLTTSQKDVLVFSGQDNQGNWTLYQRQYQQGNWGTIQPLVENQMRNTNAHLISLKNNQALLSWEISSLKRYQPQIALKLLTF